MDIVILANFAGSPQHGMTLGQYYLARQWVESGHRVTIVAASYAHTRFVQPKNNGKAISEQYIDGIRYLWLKCPEYSANDKIGRIKNIFAFVFKCFLSSHTIPRADIVISSSIHPLSIFPAKKMADRFNARLVMEVRDLWPLTLMELGGASKYNLFIMLMQGAENYAYRNADKVISVLPKAKSYMVEHGMHADKFIHIPNGIALNEEQKEPLPDSYAEKIKEFQERNIFLIGYAGRMGEANPMKPLIDAVRHCDNQNIALIFVGSGYLKLDLENYCKSTGLSDRVIFFDPVKKSQVSSFLELMDVLYVGYQKKSLYRYGVSPTKLNEYLLAAKPIIAAIDADCEAINDSQAIIRCSPDDSKDIAKAIDRLCQMSPVERHKMGANGRRWVAANRDYRVLADRCLSGIVA